MTEEETQNPTEEVEDQESTEETTETEGTDADQEGEGEQTEETETADEDTEATDTEAEQPTEDQDVDPKEEARKRYEERQRVKEQRRAQIETQGREYVEQGEDEYEQRLRAMEVERYAQRVEANESKLLTDFERAKADPKLSIFNPDSPEFNERAYSKAITDFERGYMEFDNNGNPVDVRGSLYQHLADTADIILGAQRQGAVQQAKATQNNRSKGEGKPAAQPKEAKKDPIMEALLSDD